MNKLVKISLILLVLFTISQKSFAGSWLWPSNTSDVQWEGDNSNWEDRFNFSNNQLPDNETNVIIDPSNYSVAPVLSDNSSFDPLGITLENGGSITLNGDMNASLFEIGDGNNTITINSGAQMTIADGVHFNASGGTLNVTGDGTFQSDDDFTFDEANTTLNNSSNLTINGDLVFDAANATINNDGNLSVSSDLRTTGLTSNANDVNNLSGGIFTVDGDINFSGAANDIVNEGTFILGGSFLGINVAGVTENRAGATWMWNYTGTNWDLDILSIFIDNGAFVYNASGDQNIIPLTYENLSISGSGTKTLANDAIVNGTLTLTNSKLDLGNNNLTIANSGAIIGGSSTSYIINEGAGALTQQNLGSSGRTGSILFPIGTSSSYTPLTIDNSSGTADDFSVQLIDQVYADGYSGTSQTTDVVGRTWFISEAIPGGSNATLTFQWNDSDGLGTFSPAEVHVIHYNGAEWERLWTGSAGGTNPYTATATNVSDFSPFAIEGSASPLPVELNAFIAQFNGKTVDLKWETASELNNDYFIIERSADMKAFEEIASMKGHGTTNEQNTYEVEDINPFAGTNYYRLTQVDFDGTSKTYEPVKVEVALGDDVSAYIYPVPSAGDFINIRISGFDKNVKADLKITDSKGQVMHMEEITMDKNSTFNKKINFKNQLGSGIYVLSINTPNPIVERIMVK